jgi:hypothetical protein
VRELLKRGLAGEGFVITEAGSKSADFGVIESGRRADGSDTSPAGRKSR